MHLSTDDASSDDQGFVYNGTEGSINTSDPEEDEEEFVYPGAAESSTSVESANHVPPPPQPHPSPAQLESLYAAASSGDLPLLKKLFKNALEAGDVEPFSLANDASTRTGFTALHAAASRGYLDIVTWCEWRLGIETHSLKVIYTVVEECGAIPDLEDKEGEVSSHTTCVSCR